jgi:predicted Fe-S protein YdhL (DUF1289 family)
MNQNEDNAQSPCIENCILNDKKICVGCFRSLVEIAQWSQMDDRMRLEVLDKAENRRKAHETNKPE